MNVRAEAARDVAAIREVNVAAFLRHPFSQQTEHLIVEALRAANALTVSLVAEVEGRVVGHIAFSPVSVSDGTPDWYGLGPVAVLPEYQRQGIGTALIHEGLCRLRSRRARGCCLVGDPEYYKRFGFESLPGLVYEGVPPEVFLALPLGAEAPRGIVNFHDAFAADGRRGG